MRAIIFIAFLLSFGIAARGGVAETLDAAAKAYDAKNYAGAI